ncbi:MAG: hypothetical protein ACRCSO_10715 [Sphingomonas sp.]
MLASEKSERAENAMSGSAAPLADIAKTGGQFAVEGPVIAANAIADLTRDGCRLVTSLPLAPGRAVTIMVPGIGAVAGEISYIAADGAHCAFSQPLPAGAISVATAAAAQGDTGLDVSPTHRAAALATAKWPAPARIGLIAGLAASGWAAIAIAWHLIG